MISSILTFFVAEMPLLDLTGREFLLLYGVLFIIALVWSLRRRASVMKKFDIPGSPDPGLTDPYEIAFLAGGVPRCSQLVIVRLLATGAIRSKRGLLSARRLMVNGPPAPDANALEREVHEDIATGGDKGFLMSGIASIVSARVFGIEAKLAKLGLRPTAGERSGLGFKAVLPLVVLLGLGITKVFVGISRDKPVFFLIVLLIITVVVIFVTASKVRRLTSSGESLLENLSLFHRSSRGDRETTDVYLMSLGFALSGSSSLGESGQFMGIDSSLLRDLNQIGSISGSQGGDSSSGCGGGGGSGCGSGCGGCGGGD